MCGVCGLSQRHKEMLLCGWLCVGNHGYLCLSYTNCDCHVSAKHKLVTATTNNTKMAAPFFQIVNDQIQACFMYSSVGHHSTHKRSPRYKHTLACKLCLLLVVVHLITCIIIIKHILKYFSFISTVLHAISLQKMNTL